MARGRRTWASAPDAPKTMVEKILQDVMKVIDFASSHAGQGAHHLVRVSITFEFIS
jgi:hypothetical protein